MKNTGIAGVRGNGVSGPSKQGTFGPKNRGKTIGHVLGPAAGGLSGPVTGGTPGPMPAASNFGAQPTATFSHGGEVGGYKLMGRHHDDHKLRREHSAHGHKGVHKHVDSHEDHGLHAKEFAACHGGPAHASNSHKRGGHVFGGGRDTGGFKGRGVL